MSSDYTKDRADENSYYFSCAICGSGLSSIAQRPFCETHIPMYEARQRAGVATEELAFLWNDSLANWKGRPIELDSEPYAPLFMFRQRWEDWLVFMRGYSKRLPDWIVVNNRTREIRHFIEVEETEIQNDLSGVRAAFNQADLAARWGRPVSQESADEFEKKHYGNESGKISIIKVINAAPMPVYSFSDQFFSLRLHGYTWSHVNGRINSIGFTYGDSASSLKPGMFTVTSFDPLDRSIAWSQEDFQVASLVDTDNKLFQHFHFSGEKRQEAGNPQILENTFTVGDNLFSGEIRYWSEPYQIAGFFLKQEKVILTGSAFGLTQSEILQLLEKLIIINDRTELLIQYESLLNQ